MMANAMFSWEGLPPIREVRAGGRSMAVRVLGDAGPRMLLLHGGPGLDHHLLLPVAAPLSSAYEVWLPDLPGHGRSLRPGRGRPNLSQLIDETACWLDGIGTSFDLLVGHSLGAWIARELLRRRRIAPRAAVLIGTPAATPWPRSVTSALGQMRARRPSRGRRRSLRQEILEFCAAGASAPPSSSFLAALERVRLEPPEHYESLLGQFRRTLHEPVSRCAPICPVLFLTGEADIVGPPRCLGPLVEATEGAQLRVLDGEGHVPFVSDAGPVVEAIRAFFSSIPPREAGQSA